MERTMDRALARAVRGVLVESPHSFGARSRARRWERLTEHFPSITRMRVVDLGGTVDFWLRVAQRPADVVVVNLGRPVEDLPGGMTAVVGDACDPPPEISQADFDLVFSNSVLEHVGGHARRAAFADVVRRLAPLHWIQTPNRYFPLEPHWLFPGFQFLPVNARAAIAQRWPLAHSKATDRAAALTATMATELIGRTELGVYFPDSRILAEKAGPLTKSLVAVAAEKRPPAGPARVPPPR